VAALSAANLSAAAFFSAATLSAAVLSATILSAAAFFSAAALSAAALSAANLSAAAFFSAAAFSVAAFSAAAFFSALSPTSLSTGLSATFTVGGDLEAIFGDGAGVTLFNPSCTTRPPTAMAKPASVNFMFFLEASNSGVIFPEFSSSMPSEIPSDIGLL